MNTETLQQIIRASLRAELQSWIWSKQTSEETKRMATIELERRDVIEDKRKDRVSYPELSHS